MKNIIVLIVMLWISIVVNAQCSTNTFNYYCGSKSNDSSIILVDGLQTTLIQQMSDRSIFRSTTPIQLNSSITAPAYNDTTTPTIIHGAFSLIGIPLYATPTSSSLILGVDAATHRIMGTSTNYLWKTLGNDSITSQNFIGTINDSDFIIKTHNLEVGRFTRNSEFVLGDGGVGRKFLMKGDDSITTIFAAGDTLRQVTGHNAFGSGADIYALGYNNPFHNGFVFAFSPHFEMVFGEHTGPGWVLGKTAPQVAGGHAHYIAGDTFGVYFGSSTYRWYPSDTGLTSVNDTQDISGHHPKEYTITPKAGTKYSVPYLNKDSVLTWSAGAMIQLGSAHVNMNTTADQAIPIIGNGTNYIITDIVITNSSTNLTVADDTEWWTAASRTGAKIAHNSPGSVQILTASNSYLNVANVATAVITLDANQTINNVIFSLGIPQGATATADIYIYGYIIN